MLTVQNISIIIPTYNRAELLKETLYSVLNQTNARWECIVVDDQSTDDTGKVMTEFTRKDSRIIYSLNKHTKGGQGARNTGIELAQGDALMFLDSDDLIAENCIDERIKFAQANPLFDMWCFVTGVFHDKIGDSNFLWNKMNKSIGDIERFLMIDPPWHTSGSLWKREVFRHFSGWDESVKCFQDWDIHLRFLFQKNFTYKKSSSILPTTFYRRGRKESISGGFMSSETVDSKKYLADKFFEIIKKSRREEELKDYFMHFIDHVALTIALEDPGQGGEFFKKFAKAYSYPRLKTYLWALFYNNRFNKRNSRVVRKSFDIIPKLFGKVYNVKKESTFLRTRYL